MTSGGGSSSRVPSERFTIALLHFLDEGQEQRQVWLALSHRLYWKSFQKDSGKVPESLYDFTGYNSLQLSRLPVNESEDWGTVTNFIKPYGAGRLSFVVPGRLHKPRNPKTREVKVVLTVRTPKERDRWINAIRLRICPGHVLQKRMKEKMERASETASLQEVVVGMKAQIVDTTFSQQMVECTKSAAGSVQSSRPANLAKRIYSRAQRDEWVDKLNVQLSSLTGIVASSVKKSASTCEIVANTAQDVADYAKFIPGGISSAIQLVSLSARLVVMYAEADRGCRELPDLLGKVLDILGIVAESVAPILWESSRSDAAERMLERNPCEVLVSTYDLMGTIEDQLMRSKWGQFKNSKTVEEVENKLETLKQMVVPVILTKNLKVVEKKMAGVQENLLEIGGALEDTTEEVNSVRKKVDELEKLKITTLMPGIPPPPKPSPYFVGRERELRKLNKTVQKRGCAAITGFGGLGKTQLMATFAEQVELSGHVPGGVFWITADGNASEVVESLADLAEKLHKLKLSVDDRVQRQVVIDVLGSGLNRADGRWLLCIDNVDHVDEPDVSGILDALTSMARDNGWIVVTTRSGNPCMWSRMKQEQKLNLKPLAEDHARNLLWRLMNSIYIDDENDATVKDCVESLKGENSADFESLQKLCCLLDGLPLALVQAGAYIRRHGCTFTEYLELFQAANSKPELNVILRRSEELNPVREAQRAILTTWKISIDRLSPDALSMIRAVSMLASAPMPIDLMKCVLSEGNERETSLNVLFSDVVQDQLVLGSSLIQHYRSNAGDSSFEIHRLIRLFVLLDAEEDTRTWIIAFRRAVKSIHFFLANILKECGKGFSDYPGDHGDRHLSFLPHAFAIVQQSQRNKTPIFEHGLEQIYHFSRACLRWYGRFEDASITCQRLIGLLYSVHGRNSIRNDIAFSLHMLGIVYSEQGKFVQAEAMYRESLDMRLLIHGNSACNPSIAASWHQLAIVSQLNGKLDEAEEMYRKSLDIDLAYFGSNASNPSIAASLHALGYIYQSRGKFVPAVEMFKKSHAMNLVIHESNMSHASIANSFLSLGCAYQDLDDLKQAQAMFMKSLQIRLAIHGSDSSHPDIAAVLLFVGTIYQRQGEFDEALSRYKNCLRMRREIYGSDSCHPSIASSLHQLGSVYEEQGHLDKAEALYTETLEIWKKAYESVVPHPDIAKTLHNVGNVYLRQGKLGEAESKYVECREMRMRVYGPNEKHPDIAGLLQNLGLVYQEQGKLSDAETTTDESLQMMLTIYGSSAPHSNTAACLDSLGSIYEDQDKFNEAESAYERSYEMKKKIYGSNSKHPSITESLDSLGGIYLRQRKPDSARKMYQKALEMMQRIHGSAAKHRPVANSMRKLGIAYHHMDELKEAEGMYEKSLDMFLGIRGSDSFHSEAMELFEALASVHEGLGKSKKALTVLNSAVEKLHNINESDSKRLMEKIRRLENKIGRSESIIHRQTQTFWQTSVILIAANKDEVGEKVHEARQMLTNHGTVIDLVASSLFSDECWIPILRRLSQNILESEAVALETVNALRTIGDKFRRRTTPLANAAFLMTIRCFGNIYHWMKSEEEIMAAGNREVVIDIAIDALQHTYKVIRKAGVLLALNVTGSSLRNPNVDELSVQHSMKLLNSFTDVLRRTAIPLPISTGRPLLRALVLLLIDNDVAVVKEADLLLAVVEDHAVHVKDEDMFSTIQIFRKLILEGRARQ